MRTHIIIDRGTDSKPPALRTGSSSKPPETESRKERRNKINRFIRAELKKATEKLTEETNEEPQQEEKNMTASREFLNITTKKRYDAIQVDTDTSYYVKNATDETAATRYALEKFLNKLETIGTREAETIADIIRMNLKNDEFMFTYNSISEGGNAWEIEINDYCDGTMSIYIRIAEYMCDASEEPAADQEPEEETTENYVAWCGMIENDVITEEYETLSEAVDEVETKYTKEEQKALGVTYCRLLCTAGQWLECLEEKTVDDVYYF